MGHIHVCGGKCHVCVVYVFLPPFSMGGPPRPTHTTHQTNPNNFTPNPKPQTPNPINQVPGLGVVSYCWAASIAGRAAFVIGDPLVRPAQMPLLLERFHAEVPGMKLYVAVSSVVAEALRPQGMSVTVFGNDYYGALRCVTSVCVCVIVVLLC